MRGLAQDALTTKRAGGRWKRRYLNLPPSSLDPAVVVIRPGMVRVIHLRFACKSQNLPNAPYAICPWSSREDYLKRVTVPRIGSQGSRPLFPKPAKHIQTLVIITRRHRNHDVVPPQPSQPILPTTQRALSRTELASLPPDTTILLPRLELTTPAGDTSGPLGNARHELVQRARLWPPHALQLCLIRRVTGSHVVSMEPISSRWSSK